MSFQLTNTLSTFWILALVMVVLYTLYRSRPELFSLTLVTPAVYIGLQYIGAFMTWIEIGPQNYVLSGNPLSHPQAFSIGSFYVDWSQALVLGLIGLGFELRRRGFKLPLRIRRPDAATR